MPKKPAEKKEVKPASPEKPKENPKSQQTSLKTNEKDGKKKTYGNLFG